MAYTTINKSSDYFNTKLYTGNGSTQSITGVGFQPDWVWIKNRTAAENHFIFDSVRGALNALKSNSNGAAGDTADSLTAFTSDGFNLGNLADTNRSGNAVASWNWKAGGTASSNTDGSITSTVSANTTSGFSIVSYTSTGSNATVGHGLGVAPAMIIFKRRSGDTENWVVYHKSLGATKNIKLNLTDAVSTSSTRFNDTEPTSSVFSLGTSGDTNGGTSPFIAYCFAEKTGFSKFGSYTGAGSNLPFIYTGFKPAFVMIKRSSNTDNWYMKDNKRSGTAALQNFGQMNPNQTQHPSANNNNAENKASDFATDILSNGFKFRGTDSGINQSGETYIYMAFAEAPLVGSNNIPCTAR